MAVRIALFVCESTTSCPVCLIGGLSGRREFDSSCTVGIFIITTVSSTAMHGSFGLIESGRDTSNSKVVNGTEGVTTPVEQEPEDVLDDKDDGGRISV
jgi:hypothetical protein